MKEVFRTTAPGILGPVYVEGLLGRAEAPVVALLHGVHGTANVAEENKYGKLARLIAPGADVVTIETSRLCREALPLDNDRGDWIRKAFSGKSYAMELHDVMAGLAAARAEFDLRGRPLWLWGFSLGGIHSVFLAGGKAKEILAQEGLEVRGDLPGPLDGLILSGSGLRGRAELREGDFFSLPILDSLPPTETLRRAALAARVRRLLAFYGSKDETFSEEACRNLWGPIQAERKSFHVLDGVDHAFRTLDGESSDRPLQTMVDLLLPL